MKFLQSNHTKLFTIILLMMVSYIMINAQDKKEDPLKSKLDQIKGKVEKITVNVEGKDVVFEGKDAEKLAERLSSKRIEKRIRISDNDEDMPGVEGDGAWVFKKNNEVDKDGNSKKVKIEINNGKKKVTVTTTKDGKEETKVLEGEDAEKFLKDEKPGGHMKIMMDDEDMPMPPHGGMMMKMEDEDGCCCCCCGHRMPPPPMHGKKIIKERKIKHIDKDEKSIEKEIDKKKETK